MGTTDRVAMIAGTGAVALLIGVIAVPLDVRPVRVAMVVGPQAQARPRAGSDRMSASGATFPATVARDRVAELFAAVVAVAIIGVVPGERVATVAGKVATVVARAAMVVAVPLRIAGRMIAPTTA